MPPSANGQYAPPVPDRTPRNTHIAASPGQLIAGYRLERLLGKGGMGVVWLARDERLDRQVALKLLGDDLVSDSEFRLRFLVESRIAAGLDHPHIVPVYAAGEVGDDLYLAMRYVEGEDLGTLLAEAAPLEPMRVLTLLAGIADALDTAHERGLIHRDVKPENILVTRTSVGEHAYLTDFGISKLANAGTGLTAPGQMVGSVGYIAPEHILGQEVDGRADVYALGCVMYEALTGHAPYGGSTDIATLMAHLNDAVPRMSDRRPELRLLDLIVARAMAKSPQDRWPLANEFVRAAGDALQLGPGAYASAVAAVGVGTSDVGPRPANEEARASTNVPPNNLPAPGSALIGRDRELSSLQTTLREHRLVTLVAPGGCGKSRLALEVARSLFVEFPDGVWFVELAPTRDASLVPTVVGRALSVSEDGSDPARLVAKLLADARALLVLDNFEHVLEAAPFVAHLVASAPRLHVLVTSRAPLQLRGEHIRPLAPLSADVPSAGQPSPAAELFLARASDAGVDLPRDGETLQTVRELVQRLDGLPLAIELAAARLRFQSLTTLASRVGERLPLLTGGPRDAPERQRTLRNTIAWSFDLLSPSNQKLMADLSVFAGGFDLGAAAFVCNGVPDMQSGLDVLVGQSLLSPTASATADRHSMLETVREFAAEQSTEGGGRTEAMTRHVEYFVKLVEAAEPELLGRAQAHWLTRLELEHDNLRAAISACVELQLAESLHRIVGALWWFWTLHGHLSEGYRWARLALDSYPDVDDPLLARSHFTAGTLASWAWDKARAQPDLQESLRRFRRLGDARGVGRTLNWLGTDAIDSGEVEAGAAMLHEAATKAEEAGDESLGLWAAGNLYLVAFRNDDLPLARAILMKSSPIAERIGDEQTFAFCCQTIAWLAFLAGDDKVAERETERVASLLERLDDPTLLTLRNIVVTNLALRAGDLERARLTLAGWLPRVPTLGLESIANWLGMCALYAASMGKGAVAARLLGSAAAGLEAGRTTSVPAEARLWQGGREAVRMEIGSDVERAEFQRGHDAGHEGGLLLASQVLLIS